MIVVATEEERILAESVLSETEIVQIGVGGLNVYMGLSALDRNTEIVNFGYAGSNSLPIGSMVTIGKCRSYHPNCEFDEAEFDLDGEYPCYTSSDFVTDTDIEDPCVFDMELAYILAMGFTNVKSIKVISDNLSMKEYEENVEHG